MGAQTQQFLRKHDQQRAQLEACESRSARLRSRLTGVEESSETESRTKRRFRDECAKEAQAKCLANANLGTMELSLQQALNEGVMPNAEHLRTAWAESQDGLTKASREFEEREQIKVHHVEQQFHVDRRQFEATVTRRVEEDEDLRQRQYESRLLENH